MLWACHTMNWGYINVSKRRYCTFTLYNVKKMILLCKLNLVNYTSSAPPKEELALHDNVDCRLYL